LTFVQDFRPAGGGRARRADRPARRCWRSRC